VEADRRLGQILGVNGTPAFFINGRPLVGARPWQQFKALIDEELARADAKLAAGVARGRLYAALTEGGLEKAPPPPAEPSRPAAADDFNTVYKIDKAELVRAPGRGSSDAPVTLVLFSDFQCPFCSKVEPTLEALEKAYPGKLRIVWKNFPLEFHVHARLAAAAAAAAHAQGKFWPMHDKLFAHQQALDRGSLEGYAADLGLDVARWKAGLDREAAVVDADAKLGATLGVSGTPTVFVNGRRVAGAYPLATFKTLIDDELRKRGG
jgi:protein-disulfide isomerase